jgi:predicted anti-sigma-YlaC factor YlaD
MVSRASIQGAGVALLCGLAALLPACSVRRFAVDALGGAISRGNDVFAMVVDPEFVREALPFALKATEALILEAPEDQRLLVTAASGFTQYARAFLGGDAAALQERDWAGAEALRERAFRMYVRARDYGLRALEVEHPGLGAELRRAPHQAAERIGPDEVAAAFWTGTAWIAGIALALDRPEVLADLEAARALLERTLVLDEDWQDGALHEVMISVAALPEAMGGSDERAREHFERAVALSRGERAGPFVTYATDVVLDRQDRAAFVELLERALAVDVAARPTARVANVLAQRRARELLGELDLHFFDVDPVPETAPAGDGGARGDSL